jgi:putative heme-binding domain-containing protein
LYYCLILRNLPASAGWTLDQRKAYFAWINHATANYKGGASFRKFLARIKEDAQKTLTDEEVKQLDAVLKGDASLATIQVSKPRQFIRNWAMSDILPDVEQATRGRNFENGKVAFNDAQCAACHRLGGEGGSTGPDLTGVGNRFSPADTLEAILLPSQVISDQYQTTMIDTADGDVQVGRVAIEDESKVLLQTNSLSMDTVEIAKKDIKARTLSKVSMMPQGLVDNLTKEEILDLIAYLRAAGDPKDKAFGK